MTDRAMALRRLGAPLSEVPGHIITIQLADRMIEVLKEAEIERWREWHSAGGILR